MKIESYRNITVETSSMLRTWLLFFCRENPSSRTPSRDDVAASDIARLAWRRRDANHCSQRGSSSSQPCTWAKFVKEQKTGWWLNGYLTPSNRVFGALGRNPGMISRWWFFQHFWNFHPENSGRFLGAVGDGKNFFAPPEVALRCRISDARFTSITSSMDWFLLFFFGWDDFICMCIYIYLEPNWHLFLKVNSPKQGLFESKQGSFGF